MLVKVRAYSGQKAEEFPLRVALKGREYDVKVLRQWVEQEVHNGRTLRGFLVEVLETGERLSLYHEPQGGQWFIKST